MNNNFFEEHIIRGTKDLPVGIYEADLDKSPIPLHYHKEFEFLVITKGNTSIQLDGNTVNLSPSQGIFINSGRLHSTSQLKTSNCSFIAIVFSTDFIVPEYDNLYKKLIHKIVKNEIAVPIIIPNEVTQLILETNKLFNKADLGYEFSIKGNILRMLAICISNAKKHNTVEKDIQSDIIKKVLDYIHVNYGKEITLFDLASEAHICKEHLCRIFHNISDVSPIVYLNRYRIMQSANMLCITNKTISEISSLCGFNNSSYFNKLFMRFMNCTPREYRSNNS